MGVVQSPRAPERNSTESGGGQVFGRLTQQRRLAASNARHRRLRVAASVRFRAGQSLAAHSSSALMLAQHSSIPPAHHRQGDGQLWITALCLLVHRRCLVTCPSPCLRLYPPAHLPVSVLFLLRRGLSPSTFGHKIAHYAATHSSTHPSLRHPASRHTNCSPRAWRTGATATRTRAHR